MKDMKCLRCNEPMIFYAKEKLQLGKTGWVLGDLPNLLAGALDVTVYVCPACRKLEFFASNDGEYGESELPRRTCPACGTVHDFDYPKCPRCKYEH